MVNESTSCFSYKTRCDGDIRYDFEPTNGEKIKTLKSDAKAKIEEIDSKLKQAKNTIDAFYKEELKNDISINIKKRKKEIDIKHQLNPWA